MTERPAAWDDLADIAHPAAAPTVIGHDAAAAQVTEAFAQGRLHHAILLAGPRGVGKATLATALASHILRHPDPTHAPPRLVMPKAGDSVDRLVEGGAHPDLVHLSRPWDQAAKRFRTSITMDEVRRLSVLAHQSAGFNGWRVAIVDTADDLNASATNALLKTVEEPPARMVLFILTSDPARVLPTLRSRCLPIRLRPLDDAAIRAVVRQAGVEEPLDDGVLARAGGSARRAIELTRNALPADMQRFAPGRRGGVADDVHRLSAELAQPAQAERFHLHADLAVESLESAMRTAARDGASPAAVARLAQLWATTREELQRGDAWNLDRRRIAQTVLTAAGRPVRRD